MGWIRHNAIVVTSWDGDRIERARAEANRIGLAVTEIVGSQVNCYWSFLVAPDGSKEGWTTSGDGDYRRDQFVAWLNESRAEDGGSYYAWAEVEYGEAAHSRTVATVVRCEESMRGAS